MAAVRARQACKLLIWARLGPSTAAPDALRGAVPAAGCPPLPPVVHRLNSTWALAIERLEAPAALLQKEEELRLQERLLQHVSQFSSPCAPNQAQKRLEKDICEDEGFARLMATAASHRSSASDSSQSDAAQDPPGRPQSTGHRETTARPPASEVESLHGEVPTGGAPSPVTPQRREEVLAQLGLTEVDLVERPRLSELLDKVLRAGYLDENIKVLRSYGLTDHDIHRVATSTGTAFYRHPSKVAAALAYLSELRLIGRRFGEFCVLSKCLSYDQEKSIRPKIEELNRISAKGAGWLLSKKPQVLQLSVSALRQNTAQLATWAGPEVARVIIDSDPTAIMCSQRMFQTNGELIRHLVGAEIFPKIIFKNPRLMSRNCECLQALIRTLQPRLSFTQKEWAHFLTQVAWVNQKDPDSAFDFLSNAFGEHDLRSMALRAPRIFTTSVDTLKASLQGCEAMAPGMAKALVIKNPNLLCMNWAERVKPVLSYFQSTCSIDPCQILRSRVTLARSLNGWVKPRVEFLLEQGYHIIAPAGEAVAADTTDEGSGAAHGPGKVIVPVHSILDFPLKTFQKRFPKYSGEVELEFRRTAKRVVNRKSLSGGS